MSGARVIAIDGRSGSGKSTLARTLSEALALPYINTGLMYRALALAALHEAISVDDAEALAKRLQRMRFGLDAGALTIDGQVPGPGLTDQEVERNVSLVARHPDVRTQMAHVQRTLGAGGAIMEGRDIATVIFPDAALKIFLEAPEDVRVARRVIERQGASGEVARDLAERDAQDARTNAPLPTDDALVIDTTQMTADEVAAIALTAARQRLR